MLFNFFGKKMTGSNPMQTDVLNIDELHSAFIIDENGNEIRITRDMIEESCESLSTAEHPSSRAGQVLA